MSVISLRKFSGDQHNSPISQIPKKLSVSDEVSDNGMLFGPRRSFGPYGTCLDSDYGQLETFSRIVQRLMEIDCLATLSHNRASDFAINFRISKRDIRDSISFERLFQSITNTFAFPVIPIHLTSIIIDDLDPWSLPPGSSGGSSPQKANMPLRGLFISIKNGAFSVSLPQFLPMRNMEWMSGKCMSISSRISRSYSATGGAL
jgi:hypothetical protein